MYYVLYTVPVSPQYLVKIADRAYDFKSKKLRYKCANMLQMARDMSQYELSVDTTEFRFAHSHEDKEKVRSYMIETFYREAPLPGKALNMTDTLETDDYLIREIGR